MKIKGFLKELLELAVEAGSSTTASNLPLYSTLPHSNTYQR
jgi:hypothetical protein